MQDERLKQSGGHISTRDRGTFVLTRARLILGSLWFAMGLWGGQSYGSDPYIHGMALEVESRTTIDSEPTRADGKPAHLYEFGVTPKGQIVALKYLYPSASPREEADVASVLFGGAQGPWQDLLLIGQRFHILGSAPRIVIGREGRVVVGWIGGTDLKEFDLGRAQVMAKEFREGQGWGDSFVVSDEDAYWVSSFTMMASHDDAVETLWIDSRDRHFAGWSHAGFDYYAKPFARTWRREKPSAVERVDPRKRKYVADEIDGALGTDGNLYALWEESKGGAGQRLLLSVRADGQWTKPMQVSNGETRNLQYAVASPGREEALMMWVGDETHEALMSRRFSRGRLGAAEMLAAHACCPVVVTSANGVIHLIYQNAYPWSRSDHRVDPSGSLFYRRLESNGWTEPQELSTNTLLLNARMGIDADNKCHIMWQQQAGNSTDVVHLVGRPVSESKPYTGAHDLSSRR